MESRIARIASTRKSTFAVGRRTDWSTNTVAVQRISGITGVTDWLFSDWVEAIAGRALLADIDESAVDHVAVDSRGGSALEFFIEDKPWLAFSAGFGF